ncbi:MAG: hypothetical protein SFX72_08595 [Isosphaeraceae bacterium]|nr:hypothetical protein [Isosphaeraceae bacterium]
MPLAWIFYTAHLAFSTMWASPDRRPEVVEMTASILNGSRMGPAEGWFKPGASRYGWSWLAGRFDTDRDGSVGFEELGADERVFDRLDRDRDGAIREVDFDWSDDSAYLRAIAPYTQAFRRFDADANGRIDEKEWLGVFRRFAQGRGGIASDEFSELFLPPRPTNRDRSRLPLGSPPRGGPSQMLLLAGLAKGEIGSPFEGPSVDRLAPDFTLKRRDGKGTATLSGYRGRPVVLIFGSFT